VPVQRFHDRDPIRRRQALRMDLRDRIQVRDNFDRVGTYKKVFGSFGLMDVKRGGVGSILSYPMSQGSETRVYLSRHQRSRRVSQVR
jgi:hypothetical protein